MKLLKKGSIRRTLVSMLLLFAILPLVVVSVSNYRLTTTGLNQDNEIKIIQSADTLAKVIDSWLETNISNLQKAAQDPVWLTTDFDKMMEMLVQVDASNAAVDSCFFVDADGNFIDSTGARGTVAERDYFRQASGGQAAISDVMVDKVTGNQVVFMAVPVEGGTGRVLAWGIKIDVMLEWVHAAKYGESGYASLYDNNGLCLAHPDQKQVLNFNLFNAPESITKAAKAAYEQAGTTVQYYELDGVATTAAMAPVPSTNWYLVLSVPTAELNVLANNLLKLNLLIAGGTAVLIIILASIFSNKFAQPISRLAEYGSKLAEGDLTINIDVKADNEIGVLAETFNTSISSLRKLVKNIVSITAELTGSSQELSASAEQTQQALEQVSNTLQEIAQGATEQAMSAQKAVEMATQVDQEADKASQETTNLTAAAEELEKLANKGQEVMKNLIARTKENSASGAKVTEAVNGMAEQTKDVAAILDTITNIADQTNLLALNAAIEAARAGEHGHGFAVVADEVRKLAERSGNATREIAQILDKIQASADDAVDEMNAANEITSNQVDAIEETNNALNSIYDAVIQVKNSAENVARVSEQVKKQIKGITDAIETIAAVSEENAAGTEELSA
ncbi:MAG: methyl-accepting chemotaxis protein, partial [Firmicutes bacterium]|nr:methyl-accepting chemotaxis protein [Bacillota bacterium]